MIRPALLAVVLLGSPSSMGAQPADAPRDVPDLLWRTSAVQGSVVLPDAFTIHPLPRARMLPGWSAVLLGVGLGTFGGACVIGFQSRQEIDRASSSQSNGLALTHIQIAQGQTSTANILFGAAAVALVAGTFGVVWSVMQ